MIKDFVRDKDGNQSCLLIAECANYYKKKSMTMIDALNQLYQKYGTYRESQKSLTLTGADGKEKMQKMIESFRNNILSEFAGEKVVKYQDFGLRITIENGEKKELTGFDKSDVLKYFLADGSWIAIRPSGTEPKFKFYSASRVIARMMFWPKKRNIINLLMNWLNSKRASKINSC